MAILEEIRNVKELIYQGDLKKALQKVEKLEKVTKLSENNQFMCKLLKSNILNKLGDFEASLRLSEQILIMTEELKIPLYIVDALIAKEEALGNLTRLDESLDVIKQGESVLSSLAQEELSEVTRRAATLIDDKGMIFVWKGNFDLALEHFQRSQTLRKEVGNNQEKAWSLDHIGRVYMVKGEFDKAFAHFQQSLVLREEIGNNQDISWSLIGIGTICKVKGDFDQALTHFQRSLILREEIGNNQDVAWSFSSIGGIYAAKGDFDQALTYFQRSMALNEEIGNNQDIAWSLNGIGVIYIAKNDLDQAFACFQRSLALYEEIGNNHLISLSLFNLVSVALSKNAFDKASSYLEHLRQINEKEDLPMIKLRYLLSKALLLKSSSRLTQKSKAQEIFQQIVDKETEYQPRFKVFAMLNLCELVLDELKFYEESEVLKQAKTLLTRIHTISIQLQSPQLIIQSLLLKAKFSLIDGDFETAENLLNTAGMTTEEKGLHQLSLRITKEKENLRKEMDKWTELIARNAPLRDRIEQAKLDESLSEISSHFCPFTFTYNS